MILVGCAILSSHEGARLGLLAGGLLAAVESVETDLAALLREYLPREKAALTLGV